jgi:hypothetical protein
MVTKAKLSPFLLLILLSSSVGVAKSQPSDFEHQKFQIGSINYFGYGGLPLEKIRAAIPWHVGDTLSFATFSRKPVEDAVSKEIGKPPTDVNITCCDSSHHLEVYIGLPGSTSRAVPVATVLTGSTRLDPKGLRLYEKADALLWQAVASGNGSEDDSKGYMISKNPPLRAITLQMRSYAFSREQELTHVLQTSGKVEDRRAAACLLGYVERSPTQSQALSRAISDPDDQVRNNAARALEVLAAIPGAGDIQIDIAPFIALLYSGKWTDRNKASLFLARVADKKEPSILNSLRDKAMGPLTEGASWSDVPGHSTPFLLILARIGHLSDDKLGQLLKDGDSAEIIAAAKTLASGQ